MTTAAPDWPPRGTWIAASVVLGREVWASEPYPHLHGHRTPRGRVVERRECAACPQLVTRRAAG